MKIEHLEERILEYKNSLKKIVEKRILWKTTTKDFIISVLKQAETNFDIGWEVQELNWIHSNEAVNITFDSFPPDLIELTNKLPTFQFLQGASLVFFQLHNGDVNVLILYPVSENTLPLESDSDDLGIYNPTEITEAFIVEKIDTFLKKIIKRDIPLLKKTVGFTKESS